MAKYTLISGIEFNKIIPEKATKICFSDRRAPKDESLIDVSEDHDGSVVAWLNSERSIFYISTQRKNTFIVANCDCSRMFYDKKYLSYFDFWMLDTSNVENMSGMFDSCRYVPSLDLSSFNTSHVTDMSFMFDSCDELKELDISSFDTRQVQNLSKRECKIFCVN